MHISAQFEGSICRDVPVRHSPLSDRERFIIHSSESIQGSRLILDLPFADAAAGEDGYYIIPSVTMHFLTRFLPRENSQWLSRNNTMTMLGVKKGDTAYLICVEGMQFDYGIRIQVQDGTYSLSLEYDLEQAPLYEDVVLDIYTLTGEDADYNGIARLYRSIRVREMGLIPLRERASSSPALAYALEGMPVIRIRMGWKPVPTPVDEQTPATEPPMHRACTFADVEALMEEMHEQGILRAELCLVGWNIRGHDGRWPQAFPIEPELGGEEGLRQLVAHANRLGYRIVCHTNHSDAYRIADSFDETDLIKKPSGAVSVNDTSWSGGRMYNLCPIPALEKHQIPILEKLREIGCSGFQYTDVISVVPPRNCFDEQHPVTARECAAYWRKILAQNAAYLGGSSSEGTFDFSLPSLDFGLYTVFHLLEGRPPLADEDIPLFSLVYHGYVLSNPSAETVNYTVKDAATRLKFFEYGGNPAIYFYSRFVGEGRSNWMGDTDMYCGTDAQRRESARQIRAMMDDYMPTAARQTATMDRHEKLADGVFCITYSDGWRMAVNYTASDCTVGAYTVSSEDYLLIPPETQE